ncbi:12664_t:CDS:10, partial [Ambispora leptoticha]
MNVNAPVFIPQGSSSRINQSSSPSRSQRSSGRTYYPTQTSTQPDVKRSKSSQTNARVNKRNGSPRKNNHQNSQRSHSSQSSASDESNSSNHSEKNEWNATGSSNHGEVNTAIDDDITSSMNNLSPLDAGPAAAPRNKGKIYLNHLLNFTFPPRQQHSIVSTPRRQKVVNYQPYNKERFINANFRFLVNSTGDYTVYQFDPDILLNWQDIEQVIITNPTTPSCPICLQKPTAARVTKCGHAYCLACILHYLELKNDPTKKWRKCPICWDAVYAKDLKSVQFMIVKNLGKIGDGGVPKNDDATITMKLIQRPMNSTVALPRSSTWPFTDDSYKTSPPWHFTPNASLFSKLMLASIDYLQGEYQRDLDELENALLEAKTMNYHEEIPFIEMAIQSVKEQSSLLEQRSKLDIAMAEKRVQEIIARSDAKPLNDEIHQGNHRSSLLHTSENSSESKDAASNNDNYPKANSTNSQNDAPESPITQPKFEEIISASNFHTQEFTKEPHTSSHPNNTTITQTENKDSETSGKVHAAALPISISGKSPVLSDGMYYFYQSEDGQRIYLHPLDIRILKHEFEHYENFPNEISVRVIGVEESTMTEELRKRCKYLGHLPLSCDVTFLEVDLSGVVSDKTLEFFANEIQQRQNRRKEKVLQEKRQHEYATLKEQEILNSDPFYQSVYSQLTDDVAIARGTSPEHETFNSFVDISGNNLTNSFDPVPGISNHGSANNSGDQEEYTGPKTVWGTPAFSFASVVSGRAEEHHGDHDGLYDDIYYDDWDSQVVSLGKKQKKKKLILLSNGGLRK